MTFGIYENLKLVVLLYCVCVIVIIRRCDWCDL